MARRGRSSRSCFPESWSPRDRGSIGASRPLALLLPTAEGGFYQGAGAPVRLRQDWSQVLPFPAEGDEPGPAHIGRQQVAAPAAIHASRVVGRLRRLPWHVGSFLPRPSLEEPLAAALRRPGHGVLVVGEAGAGKTVVLARLAAHLLGEADGEELSPALAGLATNPPGDPDVVVLVSGPQDWGAGSADSGARVLAQAVARALGLDGARFARLEELLACLDASGAEDRRLGRKVWLLLDGPDESEHGEAVLAALDTALPCLATYPWLRLVVSLDTTTCRRHTDPAGQPGSFFENARHLQVFTGPCRRRGATVARRGARLPGRAARLVRASAEGRSLPRVPAAVRAPARPDPGRSGQPPAGPALPRVRPLAQRRGGRARSPHADGRLPGAPE